MLIKSRWGPADCHPGAGRGGATRCLSIAVCVSFLAGCAAIRPVPVSGNPVVVNAILASQFSLSGRFSAKTAAEQVSGQFRYTETGSMRTLNLFSPLGTPLADIVATKDGATLTQANGATLTAASLAALLRTVIDLPVTDAMMSAWLQGLPSTPDPFTGQGSERDANGLLTRFSEAGWSIEIFARAVATEQRASINTTAPRRMRWSLNAQPDTEVRWVIDEWSTP